MRRTRPAGAASAAIAHSIERRAVRLTPAARLRHEAARQGAAASLAASDADLRIQVPERAPVRGLPRDDRARPGEVRGLRRRAARRVLHPVAVHYKGSGFYSTDYGKKSKGATKEASGSGSGSGSSSEGSSVGGSDSSGAIVRQRLELVERRQQEELGQLARRFARRGALWANRHTLLSFAPRPRADLRGILGAACPFLSPGWVGVRDGTYAPSPLPGPAHAALAGERLEREAAARPRRRRRAGTARGASRNAPCGRARRRRSGRRGARRATPTASVGRQPIACRPGVTARATRPARSPNRRNETMPTGQRYCSVWPIYAAGPERVGRRLRRGLAEEHRDRRRVVLARAAGAAAAEVAAEPAVDRGATPRSGNFTQPSCDELRRGQVGRQRLRERAAVERHREQHAGRGELRRESRPSRPAAARRA